jgi:hypothetical protein
VSQSVRDQLQSALGDAHVLDRELGGGGMSHVFLAHERALGRQVVVKVLLPELAAGVNVERFRREIQLAAQLQHPHIVPVLTAGEADGLPYFIMPFVAGESLRARIARGGELPIAESLRILRDVVSALAYAHARGVVHRDVKPDNVLLSGGVAVVTDFGVAKAVSASSGSGGGSNITSLGVALGTPAYMAPEQATASPTVDHRADLYALGVVAYEMLTGRPPFTGRTPQAVLAAHVMEDVYPVERLRPAVPLMLATLVNECLAKSPADRPQSAAEVMHVIDSVATPSGGTAPTQGRLPSLAPTLAIRPHRRSRWLALGLAAALVAVGATLLLRRGPTTARVAAPAPTGPAATFPVADRADTALSGSVETTSVRDSTSADTRRAPTRASPARPARPAPRAAVPPGRAKVPAKEPDTASADTAPVAPAPLAPPPAAPPSAVPPSAAPPAAAPVPRPPLAPAESAVARPRAPADPRPEIAALVSQYAGAVESGSVARLKQVYPGMTGVQQHGWEQFFQLVRDVKAELTVGALDVTNAAGEAQVSGSYTYLNTSTQRTERQPVAFRALLRRDGGAWRITQIR